MDVTIPNLGDIDEVEVIEICVAVGDVLAENDTIVVIESDKASMDIPSPAAGTLKSLQVEVGDRITEGHVIATLDADESGDSKGETSDNKSDPEAAQETEAEPDTQQASEPTQAAPSTQAESESGESTQEIEVLVPDIGDASGVVVIEIAVQAGDVIEVNDLLVVLESDKASMEITAEHAGTVLEVAVSVDEEVFEGSLLARLRTDSASKQSEIQSSEKAADKKPDEGIKQASPPAAADAQPGADDSEQDAASAKVYAGPATRRLARELGVNLSEVKGTGSRNRITKDDVKGFVKQQMQSSRSGGTAGGGLPQVAQIDFAKFGPVEMVPLTRIQRRGADNLHRSWVNLPHVTQHDETDITDLEDFRQSLKQEAERKGIKITPLAFIVKACCHALREYPNFNASLHADGQQLVRKQYINIGMAVDTPEGLVVPVIKAADEKSIWQLSSEIAELSDKARDKKLAMDDLQGGTFSVSSLGALGGTGFTPIVNAPEVAILGVSKLQTKPLWNGEAFVPRKVLPLSLSYDHRVINGADGGRFMNYLAGSLADIRRLAL
jgi:pyruvate dehydrogenase E2 component (dihydrolipoyllysine-residue acetyltransferase)